LAERSGLSRRVTPHTFRHSAATWMLRSGMNPLLVAQVLGHTSLDMIQRVYSHLTPSDAHRELIAALRQERE
jgi:integrase